MLKEKIEEVIKEQRKNLDLEKNNTQREDLKKEKEQITKAIQVCYKVTTENKKREINGLLEAMKKTKITQGTVLTLDQEDKIEEQEKTIEIKPIWKWLIENK